jgi:16S rRNA (guanine527-N7)-methyltransferase
VAEDRRRFDALEPTLREGLLRLGIDASEDTVPKLLDFLSELTLWNRRYSLIRATEEELVVRHVLDSLAPIGAIRRELEAAGEALLPPTSAPGSETDPSPDQSPSILDLGTGAGFPGVPLCVAGGLPVTLLDRSERAATFLRAAVARLRLEGCRVLHGDASDIPDRFPVVVARALSPGGREGLLRARRLLLRDGRGVVYAGTEESAQGWVAAAEGLFASRSIESVSVPFLGAPRHLVLLADPIED